MVEVVPTPRKSPVLTPSSLACLSHIPTVNLTTGCAIGCVYCYAAGYTSYPGGGRIVLYENTLEKLRNELLRKKQKPRAVYFSPSTDIFQPVPEVLELGHRVLEFLLSKGIGVAILTKGQIPDGTMELLLNNADKVQVQIGIITSDEGIARTVEPNAASLSTRLRQIATLVGGKVPTVARLAPIVPGLTDSTEALDQLFSSLACNGVRRAAASLLFLRPGIIENMRQTIADGHLLQQLLSPYTHAGRMAVRAERSSVTALPVEMRVGMLNRVRAVAEGYGIAVSVCACMNPDIAQGTCGIAGHWPARRQPGSQRKLFNLEK